MKKFYFIFFSVIIILFLSTSACAHRHHKHYRGGGGYFSYHSNDWSVVIPFDGGRCWGPKHYYKPHHGYYQNRPKRPKYYYHPKRHWIWIKPHYTPWGKWVPGHWSFR